MKKKNFNNYYQVMGPQLVHFEFTAMQRYCFCHGVSIYIFPSYYDKGANKSGVPGKLEA